MEQQRTSALAKGTEFFIVGDGKRYRAKKGLVLHLTQSGSKALLTTLPQ